MMQLRPSHSHPDRGDQDRWRLYNGFRLTAWLRSLLLTLLFAFVVGTLSLSAPVLLAQSAAPFLEITGINIADFPTITLTVYGEGMDGSLTAAAMTIIEDGAPQSVTQSETVVLGSQTLLALDSSAQIMADESGYPAAIQRAVQDLLDKKYLSADKDWLALITYEHTATTATPTVLAAWQQATLPAVVDALVNYAPANPQKVTPLYELLRSAIAQFDTTTTPPNLTRSVVVFTDGFNPLTATEREDLFRLALERRVRIHAVQLGAVPDSEQQLRNLAQNTNGQYARLTPDTPQLDVLWQSIQATQIQRMLTYRTTRPGPQQVTVQANAAGRVLDDLASLPAVSVRPPQLTLTQPTVAELERMLPGGQRPRFDTPVTELTPKSLELGVAITWPDEHPRQLKSVEYLIGDEVVMQTSEPFTPVAFPMETFDQGDYTIRVRATCELGLVSEYAIKPLSIKVDRLPPPEPPQIAIVKPDFATLEKMLPNQQPLRFDTPVGELEPKSVDIVTEIVWPDGQPRGLQSIEYRLGDQRILQTEEPFTTVSLPIEKLAQGEYTLQVQVTDELGLVGEAAKPFSLVINRPAAPQPPTVAIVAPDFTTLERKAAEGQRLRLDTPVTELEPKGLDISINVTWPDDQRYGLKRVEYTIGDQSVVQTTAPFTNVVLPIEGLDQAAYTIHVQIVDEFDQTAEATKALAVIINRPSSAAAGFPYWLLGLLLVIALAAVYLWYDPQTRQRLVAQAPVISAKAAAWTPHLRTALSTVQPVLRGSITTLRQSTRALLGRFTQRNDPNTGTLIWGNAKNEDANNEATVAKLTYLEGGDPPQANIDLPTGSTRLGRDPSLVHKVVADRHVSRYHCRITQDAQGGFHIWDEGSASGTYVQGKRIEMSGRQLQSGDIIGIGPVRYRFELLTAAPNAPTPIMPPTPAGNAHDL